MADDSSQHPGLGVWTGGARGGPGHQVCVATDLLIRVLTQFVKTTVTPAVLLHTEKGIIFIAVWKVE